MFIQKYRLQRGWSQEQLAELSGLSARTIQRLERGQTPSLDSLNALAAVFDVDLSRLQEPEMDTAMNTTAINTDFRADEALALAHVRKVKSFYMHLGQYVVVIAALAVVNLVTSPHYLWFLWAAGSWGVGVLTHGLQVFNLVPFFDARWERRQVEKHLGRRL